MEIPAFSEDRDHRGFGRQQRSYTGVFFHRILRQPRGAERRQLGMFQLEIFGTGEEFLVFGI